MTDTVQEVYTLEPHAQGWALYAHDEYPELSVLAGQSRRTFQNSWPTKKEAVHALDVHDFLDHVTITDGDTKAEHTMAPVPPDWYDEGAAGETW